MAVIDAREIGYRDLNKTIRKLVTEGKKEITLDNINGQRYIGDGISENVEININGTPGNDMAAFASGVKINVRGNAQDGIANTMNEGKIVIRGHAGDVAGYSMRGGRVYIKGDIGYRAGIHMKGYQDKQPLIIVGGMAGDFFGEYMAGGRLVLLGLNRQPEEAIIGNYIGVGMHGGIIYIRGKVKDYQIGEGVKVTEVNDKGRGELSSLLKDYCQEFNLELAEVLEAEFSKLVPLSSRPYGNLYAY